MTAPAMGKAVISTNQAHFASGAPPRAKSAVAAAAVTIQIAAYTIADGRKEGI